MTATLPKTCVRLGALRATRPAEGFEGESAGAVYNRQRLAPVHLIRGCLSNTDRISPAQRLDGMWRSLAAHLLWDQMHLSAVLEPIDRGHDRPALSAVLKIRCIDELRATAV